MNPLVVQILNSLVRSALLVLFGYLVSSGIMTEEQADSSVGQLTAALVPIVAALLVTGYGAWRAKQQQKLLVTAQALPAGVSTIDVIAAAKSSKAPKSTMPRDEAPKPMPRSTTEGNHDA